MPKYQAANGRRPYEITLLVVAVAAAGLNLRTAITSLPPLFPDLQTRLHLSSAELSLLAATPVICFGVVSAFAAWLNRLYGEEAILLVALVLLTAGLLLRGAAPEIMLFPGTALAASAIAVLNVLLSSMVKRRWPDRAGLLIGIYLTALSVGAILSSLLSVPVYRSSGGSVRLALGLWAAPAALAVLLWLPQLRYRTRRPRPWRPVAGGTGARAGRDQGVPVRAHLAGHRVHGPAEPAVLRGAVLAADDLPGPWRLGGHGRQPARADGRRQPRHLAHRAGARPPPTGSARPGRAQPDRDRGRPGRIAVGAAGHGPVLGPDPRRQPGLLPRPGHLLHDGAGPRCERRRLAVRLRAVGRLPGRQRRPAGGRAAAHRHRQLEHTGRPAARAVCRRTRHRCPGRPSAGAAGRRRTVGAGRPDPLGTGSSPIARARISRHACRGRSGRDERSEARPRTLGSTKRSPSGPHST